MMRTFHALLVLLICVGVVTAADKTVAKTSAKGVAAKSPEKKPAEKKKVEPPAPPMRTPTVHKVDTATRSQVIAAAAKIDELVAKNYERWNVKPNPPLNEEQFLRRAYLDAIGTIPTYKQAKGYLQASGSDRRDRLIDWLLSTDGYASHSYNYWADIFRLRDEPFFKAATADLYNEWVRKAFETNKPYDQLVFEMLTAEGRAYDNPATGYLLRDGNMPLDGMNNTVRVFLGTQIGCAQCHDHPFDRWTQKEFYEMAAFTFSTEYKIPGKEVLGSREKELKLKDDLLKIDPKYRAAYLRPVYDGNLLQIVDKKKTLKFPSDYQYDNAKPNSVATPKVIFGNPVSFTKSEPPRVVFAKWMTSPDNPRFAKTIANRLWARFFGVGIIDPVDDMKDDTQPENPELLEFLAQEMVRVKFDLKEFQRIIMYTKTYQREASRQELQPGDVYHFPGPILRRLTAEQVWDSFVTLASFDDPGEYHKEAASTEVSIVNLDLSKVKPTELVYRLEEYRTHMSTKAYKERMKKYEYKGLHLVRASEMRSPLPAGHFLRQFGQSDREQIQASNVDGSVPQALQMFNGPITHMLLEPDSLMFKNVTAEKGTSERMDVIFTSVLCRRASAADRQLALNEIKQHGEAGYGNVIWALVNTPEFLFVQ